LEWRQHHLIPTNAFHETALRVVSVSKLDDRKICTSAPRDNLMMLTYYNMLSDQIIVTAKYKSQHNNLSPASKSRIFTKANTLHDSEV
jgi:hypothetical protein